MQADQYHLCKIAEEAAEVVHRAMKAQQFGLGEVQPGQSDNNLRRLVSEFHDLATTFDNFLSLASPEMKIWADANVQKERLEKMERFLELSISLGMVDEETSI